MVIIRNSKVGGKLKRLVPRALILEKLTQKSWEKGNWCMQNAFILMSKHEQWERQSKVRLVSVGQVRDF